VPNDTFFLSQRYAKRPRLSIGQAHFFAVFYSHHWAVTIWGSLPLQGRTANAQKSPQNVRIFLRMSKIAFDFLASFI
jgi:hypothetical protein